MVIVESISLYPDGKQAKVGLFADTKEDVTDSLTVAGIPEGYNIAPGSSVMTAAGELAFRKSDDTWNWV